MNLFFNLSDTVTEELQCMVEYVKKTHGVKDPGIWGKYFEYYERRCHTGELFEDKLFVFLC